MNETRKIVRDLMKSRPQFSLLRLRARVGDRAEGLRLEEEWAYWLAVIFELDDVNDDDGDDVISSEAVAESREKLRTELDFDAEGLNAVLALAAYAEDLVKAAANPYMDDYDDADEW
jgi:hypothetical protein